MRIKGFPGYCPHIKDQMVPLNGGTFNLDLYLRVLREKAQADITVIRGAVLPRGTYTETE